MTRAGCAVALAVVLALVACAGDEDANGRQADDRASARPLSLVAIGDSIAVAGPDCDGCTSFVDLAAERLSKQAGRPIEVSNHAVPGSEARDVLAQVQGDAATRHALEAADVIVVEVGINDTPLVIFRHSITG